jgi:hypothetical protein
VPVVLGDCLPQDLAVSRQDVVVTVAQLLEQPRRPLDVAEEEG